MGRPTRWPMARCISPPMRPPSSRAASSSSTGAGRPSSAMSIPIIDLGRYLAGAPGALEATAAELRAALEGIGFFIIVSHGVPRDLIEGAFAEARRFHAQPYEAKMALRMNEHNNGYIDRKSTRLNSSHSSIS